MLVSPPLSPTDTLVNGKLPPKLSPVRKYVLLIIFCLASFLDSFNNCSLFTAIPALVVSLGITESESTWVISAFQLTFASFLLIVSNRAIVGYVLPLSHCPSHRVEGLVMFIIRVRYVFCSFHLGFLNCAI